MLVARLLTKMYRTILVVPCYNEADRLRGDAFVSGLDVLPGLEFEFVDDGSTDDTAHILERLVAREPARLHWTRLPTNRGKAEAVRQGLLTALTKNPDLVGYLDADLATPISELPAVVAAFDDREVVAAVGSRVALLGRDIRRSPWRHYTGRVFATIASLVLGVVVYDTQCGAKVFRNTLPVQRLFEHSFLSAWAFDVEILARLIKLAEAHRIAPVTRAVVEIPLHRWIDVPGSKINLANSILATSQLLRIGWHYRHDGGHLAWLIQPPESSHSVGVTVGRHRG